MTTLPSIVLLLVCAFLLQESRTQRTDFHYTEESSSSSSSASKNEDFKKEIRLVNEKANAVMVTACDYMRALNLQCSIGPMNRKFSGRYFMDYASRIVDYSTRMLYAIVHLCQKLVRCINRSFTQIVNGFVESLPRCTQRRFHTLQSWFRMTLELITRVLRVVYGFGSEVARCIYPLGKCIQIVFKQVFNNAMDILQNIIKKTTDVVATVFLPSNTCPPPEQGPDPEMLTLRLGRCFYCAFKEHSGGICYE